MRKKTVYGRKKKPVLKKVTKLWVVAIFLVPAACSKKITSGLPMVGTTEVGPLLKSAGSPTSPEKFDIATSSEREAAIYNDLNVQSNKLGKTIASLGNPAETGFWLKTTFVGEMSDGLLMYKPFGKFLQVKLVPLHGDKIESQISLSAMRALGIPLFDLPELTVFQLREDLKS